LEVVNQAIITNLFGILLYFDIESYIIVVYDMNIVLEAKDEDEMIPFFSIASRDFDKDLIILKKVLHQFEQRTHSENAYKFSERATLAAG
jgi:hypothetical protein